MQMSTQVDVHIGEMDTLLAWSDIVIKMWQERIMKLNVWETGQLHESFQHHVVTQSDGDIRKISFFFNVYGMYVNNGVGKEVYAGNSGDLGFSPKRQRKRWYSSVFWREVDKITRYVNWKYSKAGLEIINSSINEKDRNSIENALREFDFAYWKKHFNL
jgi:hypothetical protein